MQVHKEPHKSGYTIITNAALRDKRLSLSAVGLLLNILSLPKDWNFTMSGFAKARGLGIDTVRSAMRELLDCGYAERLYQYHAHGLRHNEFIFYEKPKWQEVRSCDERALLEYPSGLSPKSEASNSELPTPISTLLEQNKYLINKESQQSTHSAHAENGTENQTAFSGRKARKNRAAGGYQQAVIRMEDLAHLILPLDVDFDGEEDTFITSLPTAKGVGETQEPMKEQGCVESDAPDRTISAEERIENAS